MKIKQDFTSHIFLYSVIFCIVFAIIFSFNRFIIKNDYLVYYEGECDPHLNSCFESCVEECTYYIKIQKYASDISTQCGKDITDCESSSICLPTDKKCSITFCNPNIDENCQIVTAVEPSSELSNVE